LRKVFFHIAEHNFRKKPQPQIAIAATFVGKAPFNGTKVQLYISEKRNFLALFEIIIIETSYNKNYKTFYLIRD